MNREQARNLVQQTFTHEFDKTRFLNFMRNLLNHIDESKASPWNSQYVKDAFKNHIQRYERLGTYHTPDKETVDLLVVYLTSGSTLERARTAIRNFVADHLKTRDEKDAALVAFVAPTDTTWRFSYVKMEYASVAMDSGKIAMDAHLTRARRFSYIVGKGESCHTAQSRFADLLQDSDTRPTLAAIEDAFSVEAVTEEFFSQYAKLFEEIHSSLDRLLSKDKAVRNDFTANGLSSVDFAKRLMGQVVFLYFLQKKGWLGVAKGQVWGTGHRDFLRRLVKGTYHTYQNFFNDILEPLFYDTLATDRGHEAWCDRFKCRIPFLYDGLFEPPGNYDWRKIDIILPNKLFTNSAVFEEGITGTGVLDVFDRYNFTVNEAEPLEKEVAIDPEMLGKVFENLIEDNRRKGLGAYYTPREIVHYMCQQSLIHYLDTGLNKETQAIPRADIETFVHLGEQISHYEAVKTRYVVKMPKSIEHHAREIDETLAAITICDPAVGSGAFLVGMMAEIVRARCALTPYFNDVHERAPYYFKRHAIQSSLYGVDIDPGAVEIAKLRLWLSLVVDEEETRQIKPLPNLSYKIVSGNSLLGVERTLFNQKLFKELEALKSLYFDEVDASKKYPLKLRIDELIRQLTNDKKTFDFAIYFSEVFHKERGFDVVIANPPYIFARESAKKGMTEQDKLYFYAHFELAEYQINLYPLFLEKGTRLLTVDGCLCFITPNNWLTINTNKLMRKFVLGQSDITIVNFYARIFESADVDSAITIYRRSQHRPEVRLFEYTDGLHFIKEASAEVFLKQREYVINVEAFKAGGTAELIQKVESSAKSLSKVSEVRAGLKAYEVGKGHPPQTERMKEDRVYHAMKQIDGSYLKYLDGQDVCRYHLNWGGEWLKYGENLAAPRNDFRLYSTTRILVRQIPARPPYCIHACLIEGTILNDLNSMNVINICENPEYVIGVLNSRLVSWWFVHKFGKMQRGTFPQFKVNELADFPLPKDGGKHRDQIAKLARQILAAKRLDPETDTAKSEQEIDYLVCDLFGLSEQEITIINASPTT
jgi:type I restriction-modification system DNA methylase subunit